MSAVPPLPPPLDEIGNRPFSFYPAILGIEHNEWRFVRATWSELIVVNTQDATEVFVPRRLLGEVSRINHPVLIVGLKQELEYKGGAVWPYKRRVIEMPRAVGDVPRALVEEAPSAPAPVVSIGLEAGPESRIGKLIGVALVSGIVLCVLVVGLFRGFATGGRVEYRAVLQSDLDLTARDDYFAVVRKLGRPETDRWSSDQGAVHYRLLGYPQQGMSAVLMGVERDKVQYIGAVDQQGRPVHTVTLPSGSDSAAMLRRLPKF